MSILPIPSLNALLTKVAMSVNPAELGQDSQNNTKTALRDKLKLLDWDPLVPYQQHALHYVLKALGYLPTPLLENIVSYLKGPTSKQYLHANAHLRFIIAANAKLKRPLQLTQMVGLRRRFAADTIAMQAPEVWEQPDSNNRHNVKRHNVKLINMAMATKKSKLSVSWQDKTIDNADGGDMTVRCYQANNSKKSHQQPNPDEIVMLFFHGGGFCIGDLDTHHEFCHTVCKGTGWTVISVDYRLAPEYPAPTALRDCIAAYAWLAEHCHTLDVSASRIVLAGDSAGGGLSTLVAQQVAAPDETSWLDLGLDGQKTIDLLKNLPHPIAQMPIYPVTDIEIDYPSWTLYGRGLLLDHADIIVFDAAYLQNSPLSRDHPLISPMKGSNKHICPSYIIAAELDILRDEAVAYAERLRQCGVEVQTHTVLGAPHGFIHFMSVHKGLGDETDYIIDNFASFVGQIIKAKDRLVA